MYFRGIYFFALVSTGDELWNLTVPGPVKNNTWNEIGMRWSKETGLEVDFSPRFLKMYVKRNNSGKDLNYTSIDDVRFSIRYFSSIFQIKLYFKNNVPVCY